MAKVFISYSHDSEQHKQLVRELAEYLRNTHRLDVVIDQDMLPGGPAEGWPHWSEAQVRQAGKVLVVCTENYCRRYLGREEAGIGLGAVCEARLIHQELYNTAGINHKYRVILFEERFNHHVPDTLQAYHRFPVYRSAARNELADWLLGRSSAPSAAPDTAGVAWPRAVNGHIWGMADRKDLTARFERMLSGQSERQILLISAESNSGKTHMLGELKNYARKVGVACSLLDCKGCPALEDLLESVVLDLRSLVPQGRLAAGKARSWAMIEDLRQLATPVLLIVDTYEAASDDSQKWIETQLLQRTDREGALRIVIAGKNVPDRSKYAWANAAEHVPLQPIREGSDWHEYTQRQGIHISLEEAGLLALAGQGRPGVIYPLLENLALARQAGGRG